MKLKTGDKGYYRKQCEYYPARVVVDDLRQTFGTDALIVYDALPQQFAARLTNGLNSMDGGCWITPLQYTEARDEAKCRMLEDWDKKWPACSLPFEDEE